MSKLMKLWKDEQGTSAVEYALLAFLIAIVIIATVGPLGLRVKQIFADVTKEISPGTGGTGGTGGTTGG